MSNLLPFGLGPADDFFGALSHPWGWSPDISPVPPAWRGKPSEDAQGHLHVTTDTLLAFPAVGLETAAAETAAKFAWPSATRLAGYGVLGASTAAYGYSIFDPKGNNPFIPDQFEKPLNAAGDALAGTVKLLPWIVGGGAALFALSALER